MTKSKTMVQGIIIAAVLSGMTAYAGEAKSKEPGKSRKDKHTTCCGDVPVPFSSNQRVELANGEYYTLVGKIIFFQAQPFLSVDLDVHPWLASATNTTSIGEKVYPLQGSPGYWKTYENLRVKISVQASADMVGACTNSPLYIISLDLLGKPEVVPANDKR